MGLLRADLRALANLPGDPAGRRLAFHFAFGLLLLGFLSWWVADKVLAHTELLALAGHAGDNTLLGKLGMGLLPCPIAATWLGLSTAQRQLFDSHELPLWESAPIAPWRGAVQILLRACGMAVLWALALAAPFLVAVLTATTAPWPAFALVPLAVVGATVPLMATLLVVQIVLVRLFAGRALRLLLTFLGAAASVAFSTWLLLVMFTSGEGGERFVAEAPAADALPWTVDAGAKVLTAAASGLVDVAALRALLWWLLLSATLFWIGARLHGRALEAHRLAVLPLRRRRAAWPSGIAASFRRKEIAQLLQQPGALIGFLIFAFLVFVLVEKQVMVGTILRDHRLPLEVRQLSAMLAQWFLATVLVLYPHMGRIVLWDSAQWPLYQVAPKPARAILTGKLQAIGLLLLWPLVLVAGISAHAIDAAPLTLLAFAALALPGLLIALGVLAFVGTLPWLVRPDEGRQIAQGGRNFFASLLLITLFELAMSPAVLLWWELTVWTRGHQLTAELVRAWAPAVVGGAWLAGLCALGLGLLVGGRNFRKLLAPR